MMLDTNIFNKLLDGILSIDSLPDGEYFVTHVQRDEIEATKNPERRASLLSKFEQIDPSLEPTKSFAVDISRLDQSSFGNAVFLSDIRALLDAKNGGKKNNIHDALIAETAFLNKFTLVTCDTHLADAMIERGVNVLYFRIRTSEKSRVDD